jgi:hypothetical protein
MKKIKKIKRKDKMDTTFIKKILGGFIKMNDQVDIKIIISCMR